jgi:hypothetical protein
MAGIALIGGALFYARSRQHPGTTDVTAPTITAATAPPSVSPSVSVAPPEPTHVTLAPPVESAPEAGTLAVDAGAEASAKPKIGGWTPPPYRPPVQGRGASVSQEPPPATTPPRSPDQLPDNSRH